MSFACTVCAHPKLADFEAAIGMGKPIRTAAQELSISTAAAYRHVRASHQNRREAASLPAAGTISHASVSAITPSISATLRAVQALAREAQRHLKDARKAGDHKATNGAITAAAKALELVGKLRGELQHGQQVNVGISIEAKVAMDAQAQAASLGAHDVTEQARSWLAAQLEVGDPDAARVVLGLVRMVPGADASEPTHPVAPVTDASD